MLLHSLLVNATVPTRRLQRRVPLLEKWLRLDLTDREFHALKTACARSYGTRFGAYYHWYLQKLVVSNRLRQSSNKSIQRMIARMDGTHYTPLDTWADEPCGLLIATPHHGHYILSIIALIERLRGKREVFVFYGAPQTHSGNELFDQLHVHLWNDCSWVHVIHDTRSGLARALKALQNGAVVVIMPDVYKNEHDTLLIPFCDRQLNVLLGTAALARKTQSVILPVVSQPARWSLGFKSVFGEAIDVRTAHPTTPQGASGNEAMMHQDYCVTLRMFRQFEEEMSDSILCWQYVRAHFMREASFPAIDRDRLKDVTDLFFTDPRLNLDIDNPIRLD